MISRLTASQTRHRFIDRNIDDSRLAASRRRHRIADQNTDASGSTLNETSPSAYRSSTTVHQLEQSNKRTRRASTWHSNVLHAIEDKRKPAVEQRFNSEAQIGCFLREIRALTEHKKHYRTLDYHMLCLGLINLGPKLEDPKSVRFAIANVHEQQP